MQRLASKLDPIRAVLAVSSVTPASQASERPKPARINGAIRHDIGPDSEAFHPAYYERVSGGVSALHDAFKSALKGNGARHDATGKKAIGGFIAQFGCQEVLHQFIVMPVDSIIFPQRAASAAK